MTDERKLNSLAHQYAYCELGSCPCEECDILFSSDDVHEPCKEAIIYREKYRKLVEDYKAIFKEII